MSDKYNKYYEQTIIVSTQDEHRKDWVINLYSKTVSST